MSSLVELTEDPNLLHIGTKIRSIKTRSINLRSTTAFQAFVNARWSLSMRRSAVANAEINGNWPCCSWKKWISNESPVFKMTCLLDVFQDVVLKRHGKPFCQSLRESQSQKRARTRSCFNFEPQNGWLPKYIESHSFFELTFLVPIFFISQTKKYQNSQETPRTPSISDHLQCRHQLLRTWRAMAEGFGVARSSGAEEADGHHHLQCRHFGLWKG